MDQDTVDTGTPDIPPEFASDAAGILLGWLRTFWTKLYKDKDFAKQLQGSRAERCAQLYLDVLENVHLLDHSKAPVYHRERWYPIVVRKNRVNKADATIVRLGDDGVQLSTDPLDGFDEQLRLGEHSSAAATVAYELADDVRSVATCIVDNIVSPNVFLVDGTDFRVGRRSIVLRKDLDPFSGSGVFPVFDVPETPDEPETQEAVLWACDAMIDRDFLTDHSGYAIGLEAESTVENSRLVKAVWDATTEGLSIVNLKRILAALCLVPCIAEDEERVETVIETSDGKTVVTDKNVYTLEPQVELLPDVRAGSTLRKGSFLDTSVRIYPFVVFPDNVLGYSGFELTRFRQDVASLSIPGALISGDSSDGFYVSWDAKQVVCEGLDGNGNPMLRFDLGMGGDAEDAYWSGVWGKYEASGRSMAECFDAVSGPYDRGRVCGTVVPIRFFLRNLVGANTLIVVVDTDRIPENAPLYNPNFFNALRKLVPSYVRLYFVEHGTVIDEENGNTVDTGSAEDDVEQTVSFGLDYEDEYGYSSDDLISSKWTRKCRSKARDSDDDYT